jgi:beta-N-acetylhexosaminidase
MLSCSLGIRQPKLDSSLAAFLREAQPWALVLFREACVSRAQVRALCADLRAALGREAMIWIDQEGGRVARLKAPEWPPWPAPGAYGELYARDRDAGVEAARLGYRLIAHELKTMGVNGDFAPVLDLAHEGADKAAVGDRAFSRGLREGGVAGAAKHAPGHGRARSDSHFSLPRVSASAAELALDLAPFAALSSAEAAMTAHIVYEAWDDSAPATCSAQVIGAIVRGRIGFRGLLFSDDLDMHALSKIGPLAARARAALAAGCDVVLQCSGKLADMEAVAKGCAPLSAEAFARAAAVEAIGARPAGEFDAEAGWARLRQLVLY